MTEPAAWILALENGTVFEGLSFGRAGEVTGEVVFDTALAHVVPSTRGALQSIRHRADRTVTWP